MNSFYWAVMAAVIWGCVPFIEKLGLARIEPTVGMFYRSGGVLFGMVLLLFWKWEGIKLALTASPSGILYLLFGGFLASILGQLCFYHALKSGEASTVVPVAAAYPLIAFILGVVFLGEHVTVMKVLGLILVLLGVVLLQ